MPRSWPERHWLAAVFLIACLNASLFALVTPLWQAPDEPGHTEYACLLGQLRRPLLGHDRSAALQQTILISLARHDFWAQVRAPVPATLPASFAADPFLLRSASQIGDEPPFYYLVPAGLCQLPLSLAMRVRLMRLFGAGLFGLTAAITAWAWRAGPRDRWQTAMARWQPLLLALLPMPAFIAGSVNNDSLALLAGTLTFATMLRGQRLGWTRRRVVGLVLAAALAVVSKKTTWFVLPWLLTLAGWTLWRGLGWRGWNLRRRVFMAAGLAVLLVGLLRWPTAAPAGWRGYGQWLGGGRVAVASPAGTGMAVRVVDRSSERLGRIVNTVEAPTASALRGEVVTATLWVRSADDQPARGRVLLRDSAGATELHFMVGAQWQPVMLTHTVALTTTYLALVGGPGWAAADTGDILLADAAVMTDTRTNVLHNGDFAAAARAGEVLAAPLRPLWQQFAPRTGGAWPDPRQSLLFLALLFPGFWGNFGWLQHPLPLPVYGVLAAFVALAGWGGVRRWRRRDGTRALAGVWLLATALALLQAVLPMIGRDWQPQGRYLFPALLPITGLLLWGLDEQIHWSERRCWRAALLAGVFMLDVAGLLAAGGVL